MEYPKINSLFKRELKGNRALILGDYSLPEYALIKHWQVFEKIDGTNIRVTYSKDEQHGEDSWATVRFDGRTKDSQIPTTLLRYLQDTFTTEKMAAAFPDTGRVILYGEGYGPKIQSGGNYRNDVSFILFDCYVEGEWWLKYEDRLDVCSKLDIDHVPCYGIMTEEKIVEQVKDKYNSCVAFQHSRLFQAEGVVCSTEPILRLRNGTQLKFKLLCEDFK